MRYIFLVTAREKKGLSQVELAARSGIGQTTISRLESEADSRPLLQTVIDLAKALDIARPDALRFGPVDRPMTLRRARQRQRRERERAAREAAV